MALRQLSVVALVSLVLLGCGDDESDGTGGAAGGGGSTALACGPGDALASDGSCVAVGIPADGCAAGFERIDDACEPLLPAEACPPGQLALPGETVCRDVAPCDGSRWGQAPIDGTTEFVDQSFTGVSDGSEGAPWTTIGEAVTNAAAGALIAITEGRYGENVGINGKPVVLWGSCPGEVEIVGSAGPIAALEILGGADGSEVHDLSISGSIWGFGGSGSRDLLVERVYIHDTGGRTFGVEGSVGPTSATLRDSLLERGHEFGAIAIGADLVVERSVVRDTRQTTMGTFGRGIESSYDPLDGDHTFSMSASLVERNHEVGVYLAGHAATIDASVIRDTLPRPDGSSGRGVMCQLSQGTDVRCMMQLSRSVVERNHEIGVYVGSADATIDSTVIRDTIEGTLEVGHGVHAIAMPEAPSVRANLTLRDSLVTGNTQHGVNVIASDALIERVVTRDNLSQQSTGFWGEGIMIQTSVLTRAPAVATVQSCSVDRNRDFGILVVGSQATIANTVVRATAGQAADDLYGDGIGVVSYDALASATVTGSRIEQSHRAGIANFGAQLALGSSELDCSAIDLAAETLSEQAPAFDDQGGNSCGCGSERVDCRAVSAGLEPPGPVR